MAVIAAAVLAASRMAAMQQVVQQLPFVRFQRHMQPWEGVFTGLSRMLVLGGCASECERYGSGMCVIDRRCFGQVIGAAMRGVVGGVLVGGGKGVKVTNRQQWVQQWLISTIRMAFWDVVT